VCARGDAPGCYPLLFFGSDGVMQKLDGVSEEVAEAEGTVESIDKHLYVDSAGRSQHMGRRMFF